MNKIILIIFILINFVACSSEIDCFTADSIKLVKALKIEDGDYFIYLRAYGFQEKTRIYELYETKPEFDQCGNANFEEIDYLPADPALDESFISKLIINAELKFEGVYSEKGSTPVSLLDVPVEVQF